MVSKYLEMAGLQTCLDTLGFNVAGYSCATCVGASGPIESDLEKTIIDKTNHSLIGAELRKLYSRSLGEPLSNRLIELLDEFEYNSPPDQHLPANDP